MNLPDSAVEFLDVFRGWVKPLGLRSMPIICVHTFVKLDPAANDSMSIKKGNEKMKAEIRKLGILRCEEYLGCELENKGSEVFGEGVEVHIVRDVAPLKPMLCVSFRLPEAVCSLERIENWPGWQPKGMTVEGGGGK